MKSERQIDYLHENCFCIGKKDEFAEYKSRICCVMIRIFFFKVAISCHLFSGNVTVTHLVKGRCILLLVLIHYV